MVSPSVRGKEVSNFVTAKKLFYQMNDSEFSRHCSVQSILDSEQDVARHAESSFGSNLDLAIRPGDIHYFLQRTAGG